jgi:hypothetical protein
VNVDAIVAIAMADEPDASRRERDAVRRAVEALQDAGFVLEPHSQAVVLRDAGQAMLADLPAPRLQLRWEDDGATCHYELILPLRQHDIRRDQASSGFLAIPMGRTRRTGGSDTLWEPSWRRDPITGAAYQGPHEVRRPFRDGTHITWDAERLGMPAFVVWREHVTQIEPTTPERGAGEGRE